MGSLPSLKEMLNIYALEMDQDDPIKCTARKMIHMELAKGVGRKFHASDTTIVLNPFARRMLSPPDRSAKGILVVDCSWNQAQEVFFRKLGGIAQARPASSGGQSDKLREGGDAELCGSGRSNSLHTRGGRRGEVVPLDLQVGPQLRDAQQGAAGVVQDVQE